MLGVTPSKHLSVQLVPNPVERNFKVTGINGSHQGAIFNLLGQTVKRFEVTGDAPVDVSALEKGIYLVELTEPV
jgi:hypothetical protein